MYIGLSDMFKIGIGPSSSHTVGPMRAARRFMLELRSPLSQVHRIRATLYGSLAHTGRGHATDRAVLLGLMGEVPDMVDTQAAGKVVADVLANRRLSLMGKHDVAFELARDLVFDFKEMLPVHSNGMRFCAFDAAGVEIESRDLYSIGGGFVVDEDEAFVGSARGEEVAVPYPFLTMQELLDIGAQTQRPLDSLLMENETAMHGAGTTLDFITRVATTMNNCIDRGIATEGTLPGGLNVTRRAAGIAAKLRARGSAEMQNAMNWVSTYAIAVNEENAAGSRVVTAPTNGAAGVVPAVMRYYLDFCQGDHAGTVRFMLVAAAIGALCKRNASISGAEVGCQGEVGSAAAMAAGGLASALGATNTQIENAAEIALEHHLGMTCDPIGGLVQIPCIERNAMGSVKAINACSLAMLGDGQHMVSLDQAIETMRRTGADMQTKYKETSLGGLALAIPVRQVEC
jgi:L-serine dehydratase